jgi:two-component system nitrate/nitrite response regulator NarL
VTAVRVLVADDHAPTREGIRLVLEAEGFLVCAQAATGEAAVAAALRERPDVCLLDVRMPGGGGIAAAAAIGERVPDAAIVMLTVSRDDRDLFDALRAGACGYLLKDIERARLPEALGKVLNGETPLDSSLVVRLVEEFRSRERRKRLVLARRPAVTLSRREWDVLDLLREGCSTAEIAARLFVAQVTVRSHVATILRKLRVGSRVEALRLLDER